MTGYSFKCIFCDTVIENDVADGVKDDARTHLEDHRTDLEDVFSLAFGGTNCHNDCGYVFPVGVDEVAGFDCPECGHDNFPSFVQQYIYWRIEAR
ncbi:MULTISPECIES: hypothetical protein [Halorussus]|uniref:hypothetical protein n=1 Tax=Halorussus TaxID=1070314 RepID=UPI000E219797|nr:MULTISPECIES: hypothetical protein [Halorussus]NHN57617.1 hypothetical protein [Halorussus sp. JP-T4]